MSLHYLAARINGLRKPADFPDNRRQRNAKNYLDEMKKEEVNAFNEKQSAFFLQKSAWDAYTKLYNDLKSLRKKAPKNKKPYGCASANKAKREKSRMAKAEGDFEVAKARQEEATKVLKEARDYYSLIVEKREQAEANYLEIKFEENIAFARRAGVPAEFYDEETLETSVCRKTGAINIIFGGSKKTDKDETDKDDTCDDYAKAEKKDDGHGHYVMQRNGYVSYHRLPGEPHGSHNYSDYQGDRATALIV